MLIEGTKILARPLDEVWQALNNTDFLARVIPGCSKVSEPAPNQLALVLSAAVGPIKVSFSAEAQREDVVPPTSFALSGRGSAGPAGAASGRVKVQLTRVEGGTQLAYSADTEITGRMAQLGSRLIDSAARKFSEEFFANVARELAQPAPAQATTGPAAAPAAPQGVPAATATVPDVMAWRLALDGLAWRMAVGCAAGSFMGTLVAILASRVA
ncbi:MAG: carbon monoxide dehydrogenase subunit G [Hydrogenophaga sp.]|uniref:CoxG family protein n=1 Tax=Hydrogenophaga sp. TaxID=1904254 RepID=UPI0025C215F8|nr:carbon monoxide dehydrogenase subunit G [Hydrogenophaga sp.]MBU7573274.1 carbon monoxide dehydrogenase subunit G [Hydrogenophaga sp.]